MDSNIASLIHDLSTLSLVEGVDANKLTALKFKAIELLSAYAMERGKNKDLRQYPITSAPDFTAYFSTNSQTGQTSLVFRQQLQDSMHYYFSNAEEIVKGMDHLFGNQLNATEERPAER